METLNARTILIRERETMSVSAVRILVVGAISPSTIATLQRLERDGWSFQSVNTIAEAEGVLKMIRFDVVLADEIVGDGCGYDLTDSVLERAETLLVSIALSEASLWLPVVERGMLTLGDRAVNSSMLQLEIVEALSEPGETRASNSISIPDKRPAQAPAVEFSGEHFR
jgi:DNA-binding NtrC family response regulator